MTMALLSLHVTFPTLSSFFPALSSFLPSAFKLCHLINFKPKLIAAWWQINSNKAIRV
jgi:hypothetical protein